MFWLLVSLDIRVTALIVHGDPVPFRSSKIPVWVHGYDHGQQCRYTGSFRYTFFSGYICEKVVNYCLETTSQSVAK